jgi:TRAP-type uncharacterized transport system substrate-binding protein
MKQFDINKTTKPSFSQSVRGKRRLKAQETRYFSSDVPNATLGRISPRLALLVETSTQQLMSKDCTDDAISNVTNTMHQLNHSLKLLRSRLVHMKRESLTDVKPTEQQL